MNGKDQMFRGISLHNNIQTTKDIKLAYKFDSAYTAANKMISLNKRYLLRGRPIEKYFDVHELILVRGTVSP